MANPLTAFFSGLSPKEKIILYITCGIACFALLDALVIRSISNAGVRIETKITEQTQLIQQDLYILLRKDKILGEAKSYSVFFSKKDLEISELKAGFLSEIESLAKAAKIDPGPQTVTIYSMTDDEINEEDITDQDKIDGIKLSLPVEITGSMSSILDFIYSIENSKKPITVISIQLSPKDRKLYTVKCALTVRKLILAEEDEEESFPDF